MMTDRTQPGCDKKITVLKAGLQRMKTAAVAFSGGVDSAFLLAVAAASGMERLMAVTVDSAFVTREEILRAGQVAQNLGVEHQILTVDILKNAKVIENSTERCYHCKTAVFTLIKDAADRAGIAHVLHGVNTDDLADFRPGMKGAKELGFEAPLLDTGFSKREIRICSKQMELATWDLPSQSCLATRIPFGTLITTNVLHRIEQAEFFIKSLGFVHVRVRCHGRVARIETDAGSMVSMMGVRQQISTALKDLGFDFVSLDMDGYRNGKFVTMR
ncbi:MAG: ATP-dependent sacrificial sulfur transferase LarE [Desulfobacteraceae bacterium]|nr:ATP-dependent sacrificial sulfur transferase LarE [Desulfobacteraceae bacterium]